MPPRLDVTPSTRAFGRGLIALTLAVSFTGCGAGSRAADSEVTVLAAASLTDVFEDLGTAFEAEYDDVSVTFSFGSSSELAGQAADGAPGDVLATADRASIDVAQDAGVGGEIVPFATNELTIVTPPGNPADVRSLADLTGTTWVRCAEEAPCGRVATALLEDAGVAAEPASLEEDVRATLDKVASGEAEAGLVYVTDAVAAGDSVEAIDIPGADAASTTHYVTVLEQSGSPELAQRWVDFVVSERGRAILDDAGFEAP
ncbi:molybdate ABC transporter substrate-binding protein [Nocardioides piscis]|uniref:Molybdate ABC transporter substrate-binding protein n=1 Tax=Nocardioides piscis TaxID=2714938 RepID=A0A6G7YC47_9ACTN|nr:molybdate ABC transporter substrate-binding protein [Nocardioides piscis]QIK74187.1 molybdate ABC transporter substrate-binding protein [Nocardioides piscis]